MMPGSGLVRFSAHFENLELNPRFSSTTLVNLNPKSVQVQFGFSSGSNQVHTYKMAYIMIQAIFHDILIIPE